MRMRWNNTDIARGRALAEFGRGGNEEIISRLAGLRAQAEEIGLKAALPALDAALQSGKVSEPHKS